MGQAFFFWLNIEIAGSLMGAWLADQLAVVWENLLLMIDVMHLDVPVNSEVLATINAIVLAMMVVTFSHPEPDRTGAVKLARVGVLTAAPSTELRIAYNDSVGIAGWGCLFSTLLMLIHRDVEINGVEQEGLMAVASVLTALGGFVGTAIFMVRYTSLRTEGNGEDQPRAKVLSR